MIDGVDDPGIVGERAEMREVVPRHVVVPMGRIEDQLANGMRAELLEVLRIGATGVVHPQDDDVTVSTGVEQSLHRLVVVGAATCERERATGLRRGVDGDVTCLVHEQNTRRIRRRRLRVEPELEGTGASESIQPTTSRRLTAIKRIADRSEDRVDIEALTAVAPAKGRAR